MIALLLFALLVLGLSYVIIYGIVYLFCLIVGMVFSSKLVLAIWGVAILITSLSRGKKHDRKRMDG